MRSSSRLACLFATFAIAATLSSFGLVSLGASTAGASQPQLLSTGSSFAGVAITQWQGSFNEVDGGDVNFTVTSSILGMNNFCANNVNFGATDISYATDQSNCTTAQVPYPFQYMPDVAGGLAFEYNLTGQNGQQIKNLVLNAATLVGIFTGAITNWDNSAIAALNPGDALPNQSITAYYRGDPSGENYLLGDYFLHTDAAPLTAFQQEASVPSTPGQPSATWAAFPNGIPPNLQGLVPANGADAAAIGPVHTQGGIAYVETAYALNEGLPVASVINTAGQPVQPSSYNVAVALTGAILYSDLTQNLAGVYTNTNPDAYPISAYSYLLAQCVPAQATAQSFSCDSGGNVTMSTADGQELAQFLVFVACQGQVPMAKLGYSPIPPNLVEDDFQAADRLPGGTAPSSPTPQNCPNPYITGALAAVGGPTVEDSTNPGSDVSASTTSAAASAAAAAQAATAAHAGVGSNAAPQSISGSGSSSAAVEGSSKTVTKQTTLSPLNDPKLADSRLSALGNAANKGLQGSSSGEVVLWCLIFAAVFIGVPFGIWFWQRRRRNALEA
jgi:phosphate transport system substrate-binding protein